jgi:hypothetical protein
MKGVGYMLHAVDQDLTYGCVEKGLCVFHEL